jgi:hypothetical protein
MFYREQKYSHASAEKNTDMTPACLLLCVSVFSVDDRFVSTEGTENHRKVARKVARKEARDSHPAKHGRQRKLSVYRLCTEVWTKIANSYEGTFCGG